MVSPSLVQTLADLLPPGGQVSLTPCNLHLGVPYTLFLGVRFTLHLGGPYTLHLGVPHTLHLVSPSLVETLADLLPPGGQVNLAPYT